MHLVQSRHQAWRDSPGALSPLSPPSLSTHISLVRWLRIYLQTPTYSHTPASRLRQPAFAQIPSVRTAFRDRGTAGVHVTLFPSISCPLSQQPYRVLHTETLLSAPFETLPACSSDQFPPRLACLSLSKQHFAGSIASKGIHHLPQCP